MVDVDLEMVQRYLSPSRAKLAAKGVDSVRSRVVNLREFVPDLTIEGLSASLISGLQAVYGLDSGPISPAEVSFADLTEKYASDAWLYGQKLPFTASVEDRFPWGGIEIQLEVNEGVIRSVKVYTDAMDETLAGTAEEALTGCPFQFSSLSAAVRSAALPEQVKEDLLSLLRTAI